MKAPDTLFSMSFDMYGTLVLKDNGFVYSSVSGQDNSGGKNFGNFSMSTKIGEGGAIILSETDEIVFPLPTQVEDKKIVDPFYEITLNKGWKVEKINDKGDLEIVQEH